MSTKPPKRDKSASREIKDEAATDAVIERYVATHHDDIAAKLAEARESIQRGDIAPLEPLQDLLRAARRSRKLVH